MKNEKIEIILELEKKETIKKIYNKENLTEYEIGFLKRINKKNFLEL